MTGRSEEMNEGHSARGQPIPLAIGPIPSPQGRGDAALAFSPYCPG
ncbi:hypothetical protein BH20ACT24_BH20ACT24_21860 [soil metagenome]